MIDKINKITTTILHYKLNEKDFAWELLIDNSVADPKRPQFAKLTLCAGKEHNLYLSQQALISLINLLKHIDVDMKDHK